MSCAQGKPLGEGCDCGVGAYNSQAKRCYCGKNATYSLNNRQCSCNPGYDSKGAYCVPATTPGGGLTTEESFGLIGGGVALVVIVGAVALYMTLNPSRRARIFPEIRLPFAPAVRTWASNPTIATPDPTVSRTNTMNSENGGNDNGLPPGAAGTGLF